MEVGTAQRNRLVARLRAAGCVWAEDEAAVLLESAHDHDRLAAMTARRVAGAPLEHVVGWAEFGGVRVPVGPGVFVPRRRTEHLLTVAAGLVGPGDLVVDLCCGSGAIARVLHERVPGLVLHAADLDPVAVAGARRTLAGIGPVHQGDLCAALPQELRGRVRLLVANVPYVPSAAVATLPREATEHVPRSTVDGGPDGLGVLSRVAGQAPDWLGPGGHLLSEVAADQLPGARAVLSAAGLTPSSREDEERDAHVVLGRSALDGAEISD